MTRTVYYSVSQTLTITADDEAAARELGGNVNYKTPEASQLGHYGTEIESVKAK